MSTEKEAKCIHHWVIGWDLQHPTLGKCRKCGAEREFPSSPEQLSEGYGRTTTFNRYPSPDKLEGGRLVDGAGSEGAGQDNVVEEG